MSASERRLPLRRSHGRAILPMTAGGPGSNDLVRHTLKHFLAGHEAWGGLPPGDAPRPEALFAEAQRRGLGASAFGSTVVDARWWADPRHGFVLAAHDEGFYPRYAKLAADAGRTGSPGGKWRWEGGRRFKAEIDGMVVVVEERPEDELLVVTAYRSLVSRETAQPGPGLATFGEVLAAHCRKRPAGASGSGGGDAAPFHGDGR